MQEYFYEMADYVTSKLTGEEVFLAEYSSEDSDFVRFNRSQVRQAGHVTQRYMSLDLIQGRRHTKETIALSGETELDTRRIDATLSSLRQHLASTSEDPYLLYSTVVNSTRQIGGNRLPDRADALAAILAAGEGRDMVGIYAAGGIFAGFANSLGQRNWFSNHSFHLDWSFYHAADKAVKGACAGFEWNAADFQRKVDAAADQLATLARPAKTISPGKYRVYLAPAALNEFVGVLSWGGFGMKSHRTKFTPLLKMIEQGATLSPAITLKENTAEGIAANFQSSGYIKPDAVTLIEAGRYKDCMVSPRSAREYSAATNGADNSESPESLDLAAGKLDAANVLAELGTGIYVNTLWYLNYSDRPAGRITGLTRFATFWVENGQIVAPLNVMRFDETVYRVLGENLIGLTAQRDFLPSPQTYGGRSTGSSRMPGALIKDFEFTL
ncbi:MAG: TldE/PmbA family protein [Planctomycetaceae bacterium]|nr:MAG: TldE/PmbA family protein [Planctomycetaceae bacterium]